MDANEWRHPRKGFLGETRRCKRRRLDRGQETRDVVWAVETEMFLDSEETGLFDVFSEEFGEPKSRKQHESAQSLSPDEVKSEEGKFTEANRSSSGSEFSIDRELPVDRKPVDDLVADSLMFWQGESGAHLVAQRFVHFDGTFGPIQPRTNSIEASYRKHGYRQADMVWT